MRNILLNINTMFAGMSMLFVSLFLMMLGVGLQGSLIGIRGDNEGFSTLVLSLISTGYYVGFFLGAVFVPALLKKVGYIRVFAALVAIASLAAITYPMFVDQNLWLAMRLATGFCFAGIYMIAESWLNTQTYNENRAKVLSSYVIVLFVGLSVGQLFLNFGDINGYYLFAVSSIILSVASVPLLLTKQPAPLVEESTTTLTLYQLFKRSPFGVMATYFANFIGGAIVGMSAIYAKTVGMTTEEIALFVASAYIGVVILQFPIGYLSDRVDRRKVIIGLCVLTTIVAAAGMMVKDSDSLILIFGLLGGISIPIYAVCVAYVNDRLDAEEILPATSAIIKISGIGNMTAPLLIGYLMTHVGSDWFFGSIGVSAIVTAVFGVYRAIKGENIIVEDQGDFAYMGLSTTAATLSLVNEGVQLEFDFGEDDAEHQDSEIEPTEEND